MWREDKETVVIDNGSGLMQAGMAGDKTCRVVFPSLTVRPHPLDVIEALGVKYCYVGDEALKMKLFHNSLASPFQRGVITIWDDMEQIWRHVFFDQLRLNPEEHPVLLTEPALNPLPAREKTTQIMFETFNVPFLCLSVDGVLALYSSGRLTGSVLSSGEQFTQCIPVYEGYALSHAVSTLELGGGDVSQHLKNLLSEKGPHISDTLERTVVQGIKHSKCYVALDFDREMETCVSERYDLPDGQTMEIGKEMFQCPEILFNPALVGVQTEGIHKMFHSSVSKCDVDIRWPICNPCILSGGNTMFANMAQRAHNEIAPLLDPGLNLRLYSPPERRSNVWIGGSILGGLSMFEQLCISKQEYNEYGPSIVRRKCF